MILLGNKIKAGKYWSMEKDSYSIIVLLLIFLSVSLVALSMVSPYPFFRYLSPLVPVVIILAGYLVVSTSKLLIRRITKGSSLITLTFPLKTGKSHPCTSTELI